VAPRRLWALAAGLLVASVVSAVAPKHPVYNPSWASWVLCSQALVAAMFAHGAARWPSEPARAPGDIDFVVSFDDRVISLALPDGSTNSARWGEIERISIQPEEDPFLIWTGPSFVVLHVRDRRLLIPAFTVGLDAFLGRLLELPGIDRDRLEALLRGGRLSPCVLWTREQGV
jgi:hypothetical protein